MGSGSLFELVAGSSALVVVDAVLGPPPGSVLALQPHALARGVEPVSSHGLDVAEDLGLARQLVGPASRTDVHLVGIAIPRPRVGQLGLSREVTGAVARAADLALALASRCEPALRAHRSDPRRG